MQEQLSILDKREAMLLGYKIADMDLDSESGLIRVSTLLGPLDIPTITLHNIIMETLKHPTLSTP